MFDEDRTVKSFDTKDDAEQYVKELLEKAAYYTKRLANNYQNAKEKEEKDSAIEQIIKDIEEFTGSRFSVLSDFVFDMLTGDCGLKSDECVLDEYGYKVIQCIAKTALKFAF